jgi:hypothetical protein
MAIRIFNSNICNVLHISLAPTSLEIYGNLANLWILTRIEIVTHKRLLGFDDPRCQKDYPASFDSNSDRAEQICMQEWIHDPRAFHVTLPIFCNQRNICMHVPREACDTLIFFDTNTVGKGSLLCQIFIKKWG